MTIFTTNVGTVDRTARIIVGLALIAFAVFGPDGIDWKWVGWIGVLPLATAFLKWCPAYTILGIDTCGK